MKAEDLERILIDWTLRHSGYDEHRNYIGLSGIADCPQIIYHRYFNETPASNGLKLRTRYSYEIEANLIDRLKGLGIYKERKNPITAYGGIVQGHIEGEVSGSLLEIKTVPLAEHLPNGSVPRKVYWQSQAYMYYGAYPETLCLYFARDSGQFKVFDLWPDHRIMMDIDRKIQNLIIAIQIKKQPDCTCGKCPQEKDVSNA